MVSFFSKLHHLLTVYQIFKKNQIAGFVKKQTDLFNQYLNIDCKLDNIDP